MISVIYRYRPIRKLYLSACIGIGPYEKKLIGCSLHQLPWKNIYFLFYETLTYFSKCKNLLDNTSWNRIDSRTIVTAWVLSILEPAILAPGTNLKFLKCSNFDKFVFESQLLKIYLRRGLPRLLMDTRLTKDSSVAILFMPSMDAFPALTVLLFDEKL